MTDAAILSTLRHLARLTSERNELQNSLNHLVIRRAINYAKNYIGIDIRYEQASHWQVENGELAVVWMHRSVDAVRYIAMPYAYVAGDENEHTNVEWR